MTLYLKYRPQKVSELDLATVRKALLDSLKAKSLTHAFLFSGPRGTGKTSAARIMAKAINCEAKSSDGEPCNKCDLCKEITAGTAADVMELDAASNRGIDEIRELREKVRLVPMKAKYKVYIIDEVHMLTTEAANALLKTLEEPGENVVFILCTTEAEKLPETVVSRCTRVMFSKPSLEEIADKLGRVASGEKAEIKKEDLLAIARAAKGSFRDAIKITEQIINAGGNVAEVLEQVEGVSPLEFLIRVKNGQTSEALGMINELANKGVGMNSFIEKCVELLRDKLLATVRGEKGEFTKAEVLDLLAGLDKAFERLRNAVVEQLPLEIFVVERSSGEKLEGSKSEISKPETKEVKPGVKLAEEKKVEIPVAIKTEEVRVSVNETPQVIVQTSQFRLEDVMGKWGEIMQKVRPKNHSVEALLKSTRPVDFDGRKLEIEVFYKFHLDKLGSVKCREIVESSAAEVFGIPVRLELKLGEKQNRKDGVVKEEISGDVGDDIVKAASEIFGVEAI